jgi:hypothetical protein
MQYGLLSGDGPRVVYAQHLYVRPVGNLPAPLRNGRAMPQVVHLQVTFVAIRASLMEALLVPCVRIQR